LSISRRRRRQLGIYGLTTATDRGRVAWARRRSSTMALRETFKGLELVVDAMAQQRLQQALAGEPNGLEVREAGALALGSGGHPYGEDSPLHDAPPGAEHRVDAHANPEIRPHPRKGGNLSEVSRLLLVCLASRPGRLTAAARHPRPPAHELTVFRRLRSL